VVPLERSRPRRRFRRRGEIAGRAATSRPMTAPSERSLDPSPATNRSSRRLLAASLVTSLASCTPAQAPQSAATPRDATPRAVARARFDDQGHALRPVDWRRWVYVGTPLTPNALNKGKAGFPEFHNVYVEPGAYDAFMKTGTWAKGTQIVKELVLVQPG